MKQGGEEEKMDFQRRNLRRKPEREEKQTPNCIGELSTQDKTRNWSLEENKSYVEFLKENFKAFENEQDRRQRKIFLEMSYYLKCSKTPEQCRTHHQKVFKKYGSLQGIVLKLVQQAEIKHLKKLAETPKMLESNSNYDCSYSKSGGIKIKFKTRNFTSW